MPQPASVLDRDRSGTETVEFQDVLQPASCSRVAGGSDSDRNAGIQRRRFQILPLEETLLRAIPNTGGCINANSPCTGQSDDRFTGRNATADGVEQRRFQGVG